MDHLVQDIDSTLPNFGQIDTTFRRLDLNVFNSYDNDIIHLNGIDYNESLDQILISARHLDEIIILDHSTTTAEAATSLGGTSGHGGDFLWRWGNPNTYSNSIEAQSLHHQHDAQWIPSEYPNGGKISVFDNDFELGNKSAVHIILPETTDNNYALQGNTFTPDSSSFTWTNEILGRQVYENKKSGVQFLPNGNFIVCENSKSRITEIDTIGNIIWSYMNPSGPYVQTQGEPNNYDGTIFRSTYYPDDYLNFTPESSGLEPIEVDNSISETCTSITSTVNEADNDVQIFINRGIMKFSKELTGIITVKNTLGQTIFQENISNSDSTQISYPLQEGVYVISFYNHNERVVLNERFIHTH